MCHGLRDRDWMRQVETEEEDEVPEFLNEESAGETEALTDGGESE